MFSATSMALDDSEETRSTRKVKTYYSKEPETLSWIDNFDIYRKSNSEDLIFWDIGANVGLYSIYAATKYDNISVFAFEPSALNLNILTKAFKILKKAKIFIQID